LFDPIALTTLAFRQRRATAAEILVLRRQIALYKERGIKPRRIDPVTRISLALLSRFFNWREALVVVRPETMIRWHRAGWKLFWRLKSRPGRPPIPPRIQALIRRMANENPSWGEERIANELLVKLDVQVSPRTVSKYIPKRPMRRPRGDMRWSRFLRLHAQGIIACSRQDKPGKGGSYVGSGNHSMESSGFDSHPEKVNHRPEASLACECGNALLEA
jgi:putative transposase